MKDKIDDEDRTSGTRARRKREKNSRKHERNIAEKRTPDYDIDLVIAKMNHN